MLRLNDYQCPKCGLTMERIMHEYETQLCPEDGCKMEKLPPIFRINTGPVPITGHYDETLDTFITSNTHRKKVMEQQGVMEKGATPKPDGQAWV